VANFSQTALATFAITPSRVDSSAGESETNTAIACDNGFIDSNPCQRVRKEKEAGKRERYLTFDEEHRLMKVLKGKLDYLGPAVIVSIGTGLRKSELLRLAVDHVNFSNVPKFYAGAHRSFRDNSGHL
jgi:integrase